MELETSRAPLPVPQGLQRFEDYEPLIPHRPSMATAEDHQSERHLDLCFRLFKDYKVRLYPHRFIRFAEGALERNYESPVQARTTVTTEPQTQSFLSLFY